jgi:hypothetical protein
MAHFKILFWRLTEVIEYAMDAVAKTNAYSADFVIQSRCERSAFRCMR